MSFYKNLVASIATLGFWFSIIGIAFVLILVIAHDHDSHDHAPIVDFEVTTESTTPGKYIHPNNGGTYYRITLNAPITLSGNPKSGEIECSNKYGSVTVVMAYSGVRGVHDQPVHGSRTILYNGLPDITSTLEITDTLDRCNGVGTWKTPGFN